MYEVTYFAAFKIETSLFKFETQKPISLLINVL